jgi:hypothetical protein
MSEAPDNPAASDIHPDVLEVVQKIVDLVSDLVSGVETLDANNWLDKADKIDALNNQLQGMLLPLNVQKQQSSSKRTTSQKAD